MPDNFRFDITGAPLDVCLAIAFADVPGGKVVCWTELDADPDNPLRSAQRRRRRLVLFWHEDAQATALPAPMEASEAEVLVRAWLRAADYGPQPDHDGDNTRGWRVYNEDWASVAGTPYAFAAIEPVWLMHGR